LTKIALGLMGTPGKGPKPIRRTCINVTSRARR
jgi:hypothetical protein